MVIIIIFSCLPIIIYIHYHISIIVILSPSHHHHHHHHHHSLSSSSPFTIIIIIIITTIITGEAFDKAARLLGLRGKSSGGVAIEQQAEMYRNNMHNGAVNISANAPISSGLTIPMRDKPNCDFSYAGIIIITLMLIFIYTIIIVKTLIIIIIIIIIIIKGLKNSFRIAVQLAREEYGT